MVLIGIIGELGSGKTLSLTYMALRNYYKNKTIYSNYKLNFPYKPISNVDDIVGMKNGFLCADELWTWVDSRVSGSKKNKFITMVLAKSRKRGIDIGYTAQYFKSIDVRIRSVTDFIALPKLNDKETICTLPVYSNPSFKLQKIFKFRAGQIFKLYDTNEEIEELTF